MPKRGKRYTEAAKTVGDGGVKSPQEAIELVKSAASAKFDETVDVAIQLGVDPKHGDQMVRGNTTLPHGTGKVKKVAVVTQGDGIAAAEGAGADKVGGEELVKEIQGGWMDFEVLLATEDVMGLVGRLGAILRAKMPSKKAGTVAPVAQIANVVKDIKTASRVEYRVEKEGIVHCPIGKVSFDSEQLIQNLGTLIDALVKAKPSSAKGRYLQKIVISSTMGPGVEVDATEAARLLK
ncbi:MAG: 50S ribosomal protein L1 [Armatimonadetes bacterium]|jgi:large subunit ribosomal protein L1|nr:50S ribosomal protein L1 [Armatimonadota bacterium]